MYTNVVTPESIKAIEVKLDALKLEMRTHLMGSQEGMAKAIHVLLGHLDHVSTQKVERRGIAVSIRLLAAQQLAMATGSAQEPLAWTYLRLGAWCECYARWREQGSYHDRTQSNMLVSAGTLEAWLYDLKRELRVFAGREVA